LSKLHKAVTRKASAEKNKKYFLRFSKIKPADTPSLVANQADKEPPEHHTCNGRVKTEVQNSAFVLRISY